MLVNAIMSSLNINLGVTIFSPTQEIVTIISLKFGVDKLIITLINNKTIIISITNNRNNN
jgi:hypothetical protein